ncbi:MAG TPA: hypothetical protein DC060_15280 [Gemmatimonadetes bacterium]|jgi:hypothetical protein|nr:hypothetical protein [Gemmatimonadota bacterium]HAC07238.1 hypothetical protein [Gemmatimonadota bacterium]HBD99545.1 hypothetical protein [Gemmatimonadota bacterium]HIC55662.1 hypothetical protein [Gemmatimonadota bacterium]HIN49797.1 hypothetical protein [Gemmatimonadota bacterium]
MRLKSIRIGGALIAATALLFAGAQQASAQVMMTGDWTLEVSTDNGVTMPELTLEQDGMKLTGHYVSEALGANEVTGTVDGNKVTVSFMASLEGVGEASVLYIGTVDDEGVWSGTIDILDGQLTGTFTAKKN